MTTLIRRCTLITLSALLTLSGAALAAINHDFDVAADGGKLVVEAEGARLNVRGGSGNQVRVAISRGSDDADEIEDDYDIEFSQRGDSVTVTLEHRRGWSFSNWFSKSLVVEIDLPTRFDVDLRSSGGSVTVRDLIGNTRAQTSGGSLRFEDVDGPIYGRTSGGSIYLEGTTGDADVVTSGGSIRIGKVDGAINARTSGGSISIEQAGGPVFAKTSGGSINVGEVQGAIEASTSGGKISAKIVAQPNADSKLTTSGGSVTVYLEPSIAVALDARTSGGRVHNDLPIALQGSTSKTKMVGNLNGGGPKLTLRSSGGSVNVRAL